MQLWTNWTTKKNLEKRSNIKSVSCRIQTVTRKVCLSQFYSFSKLSESNWISKAPALEVCSTGLFIAKAQDFRSITIMCLEMGMTKSLLFRIYTTSVAHTQLQNECVFLKSGHWRPNPKVMLLELEPLWEWRLNKVLVRWNSEKTICTPSRLHWNTAGHLQAAKGPFTPPWDLHFGPLSLQNWKSRFLL